MATATQEAPVVMTRPTMSARQEYILELVESLQDQALKVADAKRPYSEAQQKANQLKKIVEEEEEELKQIELALIDARGDKPIQKKLFGKEAKAAAAANKVAAKTSDQDPGKTAKISVLADHGMSPKKIEILEAHDIGTIAELEARMRTDEWWHKKIKGFGEKNVDALSDALFAWRKSNPVPEPGEKTGGDVTPVDNLEAAQLVPQPDYLITLDEKLQQVACVGVRLWKAGEKWVAGMVCSAFPGSPDETRVAIEDATTDPACHYDSRSEAISACCARMEKAWKDLKTPTGKKVAKRIAETRWLLEEEIAAAADEAASKPAAESIANANNAAPSEVEGIETVAIPSGDCGFSLALQSHQNDNGVWSSGFIVESDGNLHIKTPMPGPQTFGTSEEALRFGCQALIRWLGDDADKAGAKQAATEFLGLIGKPEPAPVPF